MKQVLINNATVSVEDVPAPLVERGGVLVRVCKSCISTGTELAGIREPDAPLWRRALEEPSKIAKAVRMAAKRGLRHTASVAVGTPRPSHPSGYSAAGIVTEVGEGVRRFKIGDRVACAGGGYASHAEYITVPENLCCPIPNELDFATASTVTIGAIALQGIRRAEPTLGETFVVVGLGALGQLTAQMLKANGCRVIGIDLDENRSAIAQSLGIDVTVSLDCVDSEVADVWRRTDGVGADGVIVTAASSSDEILSSAFQMCRKKARVVLVGDVGLNIKRPDIYRKELDFRISTSYGPGRYDRSYEEDGNDYPVSYVRWTENRNMSGYLQVLSSGAVRVDSLINVTVPLAQASDAYDALRHQTPRPILAVLDYGESGLAEVSRVIQYQSIKQARDGQVSVGVIGAGRYAKSAHLPNVTANGRLSLRWVASRSGHNAHETARQFGAEYATTDVEKVLNDDQLDAVIICTRHNHHASLALRALEAGKHVLVEKPLAIDEASLAGLEQFFARQDESPILFTGFNRRFSPHVERIKAITSSRSNPMILNYRMNAGYVPLDHWVHGLEGGGRNLGEACHVYDLFNCLTDSKCVFTQSMAVVPQTGHYCSSDNFVASFRFDEGSIATLTYTSLGHKSVAKEKMEVYCDGKVLSMTDYRSLALHGCEMAPLTSAKSEKGHKEMLDAFADAIESGDGERLPLWQQFQASRMALAVTDSGVIEPGRCAA
jgi:predicted dehydrogenase/threonine dehydrogenase-like Zn-dependent dehydrogenase